ncbi:MAG: HDOD domain-containing protein [Fibrobacter sp.]|nr:HDOD domain-containing protein [Fibrobacter sp.]
MTQEKKAQYLKRISESLLNLPTLPTLAARLIDLVDHPNTNAATLARFVRQDQVITARLLKMCNSAYYGLGREITSVHQAVILLGFDMVKEISLGVSVINAFRTKSGFAGFDITGFWDHSSAVGMVARKLAQGWHPTLASEAFTAGLLHDIGKVILIQYMSEEFAEVVKRAKENNSELYLEEREEFGTDHGQIGAWLASKWKLPQSLRDVMLFHHNLGACPAENKNLVALVYLADVLCRLLKAGDGGNPATPKIDKDLYPILRSWGVEPTLEAFKPLLEDLSEELESVGEVRSGMMG